MVNIWIFLARLAATALVPLLFLWWFKPSAVEVAAAMSRFLAG